MIPRRRGVRALGAAVALLSLAACNSPNRGVWRGTFDGSVAGTVEFRINARGTRLTGRMEGTTREGAAFHAEMEGSIHGDVFSATFEGRSDTDFRPVPFDGRMGGRLVVGDGQGDWRARLRFTQEELHGSWNVHQVGAED